MLPLSFLPLALVAFPAAATAASTSTNTTQPFGSTIPTACQSDCAIINQVVAYILTEDVTDLCSDKTSSQLSTCFACMIKNDPSQVTSNTTEAQQDIDYYVQQCKAAGHPVTPPKIPSKSSGIKSYALASAGFAVAIAFVSAFLA